MTADHRQRSAALDPTQSFIVQAPAGSGKTELLIRRFLALLGAVDTPESVVAITFTKKAAAEMAGRAMRAIRLASENVPCESAHEQVLRELALAALRQDEKYGWRLLENPSRLQIQTIDALCLRIAGRMPWVARLGALPGFTEKPQSLYQEAARETLRLLEQGDPRAAAIETLLLHRDNNIDNVTGLIAQMLERRDQWLRHTGVNPDLEEVRQSLEESLRWLIEGALDHVRRAFPSDLARRLFAMAGFTSGPQPHGLSEWQAAVKLALTDAGDWRKKVDIRLGFAPQTARKQQMEQLLSELRQHDELREVLKTVQQLPPDHYSDEQWAVLSAVIQILPVAVAQLQIRFRERNEMDFNELSLAALRALGPLDAPTDLGLALGQRIEHLLMDEFQDTSESQFELLRRLTVGWAPGDGRTLFLVGDPMQSIYRFREAEVGLFLKAKSEGVGDVKLTSLTLSANFRSDPAIVDWANATFRDIFPDTEDANRGAVRYSESTSTRAHDGGGVSVEAFLDGNDAIESARALRLIEESVAAGQRVAVLARGRSHLVDIAARLREQGLRFQAVELEDLGARPVIQDLLALTFALLHRADRVSWLSILRAPWCGLTLADLEVIAGGAERDATIWDQLHRAGLSLSPDGAQRFGRVRPILEKALAECGRRDLRTLVEDTWRALGGPSCAEGPVDLEDAAAFFDLLEQSQEGGDLADFQGLRAQANELYSKPDPEATEALQLMTIHKAKGLEFDVVILPGLHRLPKRDDGGLLEWLEENGMLLLAPMSAEGGDTDPIYKYVTKRGKEKGRNEVMRLLYVAATRARKKLYLLGSAETDTQGLKAPRADSLLGLLWNAVQPYFQAKLSGHTTAAAASAGAPDRRLRRVPEGWTTPPFAEPAVWEQVQEAPAPLEEITFEWVSDSLRHAGTVLHAFLQRVAREGPGRWDAVKVAECRNKFRAGLANLGVPPGKLDETATRVEDALTRCLESERGRWILASHREAQSEFELSGVLDGRIVEARIDRTFIDEQGVRWIIDYKNSTHRGGDKEAFLNNEQDRYREQLERYARLMMLDDPRPVKLGLYFPLLNGWREWEAPARGVRTAAQANLFDY
jgi:ATP-dependent exoDNAse (exonuclease V) beta subunit